MIAIEAAGVVGCPVADRERLGVSPVKAAVPLPFFRNAEGSNYVSADAVLIMSRIVDKFGENLTFKDIQSPSRGAA